MIPPREQIDPRLKEDIAVLHLAGISNRVMAMISKRILGVEVSTDTVTKSLSSVEDKALDWLDRPLEKKYWALFLDGTNFKMQRRQSTEEGANAGRTWH
ncbi:MAG: transposase [Bdellovibrionales bacterium]|nr:transposase [Bdellovibrionales bacterium]